MGLAKAVFKSIFKKKGEDAEKETKSSEGEIEVPREDELLQLGFTKQELDEMQISELLEIQERRFREKRPRKILPENLVEVVQNAGRWD